MERTGIFGVALAREIRVDTRLSGRAAQGLMDVFAGANFTDAGAPCVPRATIGSPPKH
jgi:hypothetical protein